MIAAISAILLAAQCDAYVLEAINRVGPLHGELGGRLMEANLDSIKKALTWPTPDQYDQSETIRRKIQDAYEYDLRQHFDENMGHRDVAISHAANDENNPYLLLRFYKADQFDYVLDDCGPKDQEWIDWYLAQRYIVPGGYNTGWEPPEELPIVSEIDTSISSEEIIGAVVGGICGVILLVILVVLFRKNPEWFQSIKNVITCNKGPLELEPRENYKKNTSTARRLLSGNDNVTVMASKPLAIGAAVPKSVLVLSCFTQVLWIVLGYFLFKRYKKSRADAVRRKMVIPLHG